jgi:hypothetical protein
LGEGEEPELFAAGRDHRLSQISAPSPRALSFTLSATATRAPLKWARARYVATRKEIAQRYAEREIVCPGAMPCRCARSRTRVTGNAIVIAGGGCLTVSI